MAATDLKAQADSARNRARNARQALEEEKKKMSAKLKDLKANNKLMLAVDTGMSATSFGVGAIVGGVARGVIGDTFGATRIPVDATLGVLVLVASAAGAVFVHPALRYGVYGAMGMVGPFVADLAAFGTVKAKGALTAQYQQLRETMTQDERAAA